MNILLGRDKASLVVSFLHWNTPSGRSMLDMKEFSRDIVRQLEEEKRDGLNLIDASSPSIIEQVGNTLSVECVFDRC